MKKQIRKRLTKKEADLVEFSRNMKYNKRSSDIDGELHVVMGCMHFPFHNKKFFKSILSFLEYVSPNLSGLHLIGDIVDMHSISFHDVGNAPMEGLTLSKEYKESRKCLDAIDRAIGDVDIERNYIWGNHEDRYNRRLKTAEGSKLGRGALLSPSEALELKERGYNIYEDWKQDSIQLGDLTLIHGEYTNIHAAKKHLDVVGGNVMFAHTHRIQQFDDHNFSSYNIGWGGDIHSGAHKYASRLAKRAWRNGFAVVFVDSKGKSHSQIIRWDGDCFFYNGKQF